MGEDAPDESRVEGELSGEWISAGSGIFKITLWGDRNSERLGVKPKDTQPVSNGFRFLFINVQGLRESFPALKSRVLKGV